MFNLNSLQFVVESETIVKKILFKQNKSFYLFKFLKDAEADVIIEELNETEAELFHQECLNNFKRLSDLLEPGL